MKIYFKNHTTEIPFVRSLLFYELWFACEFSMLWYIVSKLEKMLRNFLSQIFVLKKGFIKYNKSNGIILTKNHVDFVHPKLFVQRKAQLVKKTTMANVDNLW
jgi:hypothetical protein